MSELETILTAIKAESQEGTVRLRSRLSQLGPLACDRVTCFGIAYANEYLRLMLRHGGFETVEPKQHPWAAKSGAKSQKKAKAL